MASSSSSPHPKDENRAFSGIEPEGIRRKVSESTTLYDVFINHRGPDTKETLALPLYKSLEKSGIRAFLDKEEMELGQSFPSTIETAINSAAVHIAILSKRYAESPWCLAELVLMLHSPAKIIPVFCEVEPWELRRIEKGVYADAFIQYQKKSRYLDKLKQWKEALQSISFTTGHEMNHSNMGDYESILLAVQREVQRIKPLHVARYPVALDKLVQDFERRCLRNLVQDFEFHCRMNNDQDEGKAKIVGIFGMGGVGKTTLSKELFNRKRQHYDRVCFLFDVRESSVRCNLPSLQMKLLKDLFGQKDHSFQSTEEGLSCISNCIKRSSSLSFLIVLDDIDHQKQLDDFSIKDILEKPGNSLVIITTRDVGILIAKEINVGYHLKGMDKDDARQLFSWHAFSQPHPARGYANLVDDFLGVCGGLPLSLQVLGSHVHGRDENYWRSQLEKLGRTMHQDIRKNLKISFDALDTEEKQIFMDMACFFVDQLKCIAIRVWNASGWSADSGLQALKDKCLVEEIDDPVPVLRMHDHLRDLGREMANELSQPRRLWHPQDLKNLESKGFENIIAQTKERCFHSIFDKSLNFEVKFFLGESHDNTEKSSCLLLLHLWYPYLYSGPYSSELSHPRHAQHESLRVQPGIPSWIPLQHIQCLRISNGYFKRLWPHDVEAPSELKTLEIYRTVLAEYPDFLEIITHVEKEAEKEVNEGKQMSKIKSLIVKTCRRLSGTLPTTSSRDSSTVKAPLSLLEDLVINEQENIKGIVLNGTYCPGLQSLELSSMKNLIELQFARVEKLNRLSVSKCEFLKILSVTSDLTKLEELSISGCPMLEEPNLANLSYLKKIRIADCNMDSVPGISSFELLVELNVSRCPKLHELCLAHLSCLETLEVKDCDHLKSVTGLSDLLKLVEVSISWCWMLQLDLHLVGLNSLKRIKLDKFVKVKSFELIGCKNLETVSGISFERIGVMNICGCPELKDFPDICSPSCLELIIINGCGKLNHLRLTTCGILKRVSGNFDLNGLFISDCPMLEELPSFEHLIYLEEIHILRCGSLQNVTLPMTLKRLELNSCTELKTMVGSSGLTKLAELRGHPTNLRELHISDCPVIEEIAVVRGLSCVERITVDGLSKCSYLHVTDCTILKAIRGKLDMAHLAQLWISDCPELEELPCFAHLTCLEEIRILRCSKLQKVTLPRTLKNLQLESCKELKSLSEISHLTNLVEFSISWCWILQLDLHLVGLNSLRRIKLDMFVKVKSFELIGCKNLETVSGISFEMIRVMNICGCPELKDFPDICSPSCLELIIINGCGKLDHLRLTDCGILKRVSGNFDLNGLFISDCPMLEELPSSEHLIYLEEIHILRCGSLQNMTLPMTLKHLELNSCTELKTMLGISGLTKLAELDVKRCPKLPLELNLSSLNKLKRITIVECWSVCNMTLPATLIGLTVQQCMKLQFGEGIGHLTKLRELHISECPVIEEMPIVCGLSFLENITIDGWNNCSYLHVTDCAILKTVRGNLDIGHLTQLWISNCPELEELPCFAHLPFLEEIRILRCSKLKKVNLPRTLKNLQLDSCKELGGLSEISHLTKLVELNISQCEQLKLELHLEAIDSLQKITFDGCGKLKSFVLKNCQNLKRVLGNFDVERISICGCHELEELFICNCPALSGLKEINIESCDKLQNITLPAKLTNLIVQRCRHVPRIARMDDLSKLVELDITECPENELLFLAELSCLERITINSSDKLHKIILPASVLKITVQWCRNLQMVAGIGNLSKLKELYISKCPQLEDLPVLFGLNSLESITIDRCGKLDRLELADCGISEGLSCNFDVERISICGCDELEELLICDCPALGCLKEINIESCDKLQKITLPAKVTNLIVQRCRHLPRIAGMDDLSKLTELDIIECPEIELLFLAKLSCLESITINSCDKLNKIILPVSVLKITVQWCRNLQMVSGIGNLSKLIELYINKCPQLEDLPVLFGLNSLESITIDECGKLNCLKLADCGISEGLSCSFDVGYLVQLMISDCPALEELPCFGHLTCLEGISIIRCMKLQKRSLPIVSKNFHLDSCKKLKCGLEMDNLPKLTELYVSECPLTEELPILAGQSCSERIIIYSCEKLHKITLPTTLMRFTVQWCRKLQTVAAMDNLTKPTEFYISKCPELEQLTVLSGLRSLERITIDGCEKLIRLQVADCAISQRVSRSIDLGHMLQLWISDCPELEELSCFERLTCLEEIHIFRCRRLHKIAFPISLKNLELDSCRELKSVSELSRHKSLVDLIISDCQQLELKFHLEDMDSLQTITFDGCGKHKSLLLNKCQNLKRLAGNLDVELLSICACPKLEELPNLAGSSSLEEIDIDSCDNLPSITLPTALIKLTVRQCIELQMITAIGGLPKLTDMRIGECKELEELPDLTGSSCLERINISSCDKLHIITIPTTLVQLTVWQCIQLQTMTAIGSLPKLTDMCIGECEQLEELPDPVGSSCLERINISSCDKLQSLTLARTLNRLIVCRCRELQTITAIGGIPKLTYVCISECEELEGLPYLAGLSDLFIFSCQKLHRVALPTTVRKLTLKRCRNLQTLAGMGDLKKLTELHISECPEIEEMPVVSGLSCLERVTIYGCVKFKYLHVIDCAVLKVVEGSFNLGHLAQLWISDCPELEELPCFANLTSLLDIRILRCRKLQKVTLPRTLKNLQLDSCKELKTVSEISHLKNLAELIISGCGQLELELRLESMNSLQRIKSDCCVKMIVIDSCEKLQSILLPTTLIKLTVRRCRELSMVEGISNLTKLEELSISECPRLEVLPGFANLSRLISLRVQGFREFPILGRMSRLQSIIIESCERLENIQGIEENQALEAIQILYCSNAAIQDCISKLKRVPSNFIQLVGRAADGAESNLKPCLLSEAYLRHPDLWPLPRATVIICGLVVVNSSAPFHTINESLENSTWKFNLPQGEWVITTMGNSLNFGLLIGQYILRMRGIMKRWCVWSVQAGEDWRIFDALNTVVGKLHQK